MLKTVSKGWFVPPLFRACAFAEHKLRMDSRQAIAVSSIALSFQYRMWRVQEYFPLWRNDE